MWWGWAFVCTASGRQLERSRRAEWRRSRHRWRGKNSCETATRRSSQTTLRMSLHRQHIVTWSSVREYVFYGFFSDFKKTWFFTFFWNDVSKSRKNHKEVRSLLNVYRNFGLKTQILWAQLRLSHTVLSCIVSCVHSTLLSKMFDVGDRDLPVLTYGNWVIKD